MSIINSGFTISIMARVQYTVPEPLKQMAEMLLNEQGIPPRVAMVMFYKEIVHHRGLPFQPSSVPNKLTAETIQKSDRGEDVVECEDADDMFKKLEI